MTKRITPMLLATALLGACGPSLPLNTSDDSLSNIYSIEPLARQMNPQADVALLYVFVSDIGMTNIRINGEVSAYAQSYKKDFYLFCLPAGRHTIEYAAVALTIPNRQEFMNASPGTVHVRLFNQGFSTSPDGTLTASQLIELAPGEARRRLAITRLGTDPAYANSKLRCRSLS